MEVKISDFEVKKMKGSGQHLYLSGTVHSPAGTEEMDIYFRDRLEEKKVFSPAELTLSGERIQSDTGILFINAAVVHVRLQCEVPLADLTIKDRLNASGLIHEFRVVYRRDKIRAVEILKVLGVSEKMAEEILLRNSYILPFI